jgi:hypothetical protein
MMDEKVKISVVYRENKYEVLVGHGSLAPTRYPCETKKEAVDLAQKLAKYHNDVPEFYEEQQQEEEPTATCVNNIGMVDRFDLGVSYLVTPTADPAMILATDKYGEVVEVMAERFKMDEVQADQKPLSSLDQRINELLAVVHKYENEVNPQAREYQEALAELEPLIDKKEKQEADERAKSIQPAMACGTCRHWDKKDKSFGICKGDKHLGMTCGQNATCTCYEVAISNKVSFAATKNECQDCNHFREVDSFSGICEKHKATTFFQTKGCPDFVEVHL